MKKSILLFVVFVVAAVMPIAAMDEGTRHITGSGVDVYFMNDKVFGTASGHPLWAIYNCGTDIKGEIDLNGTYHRFDFTYHKDGERMITGKFGERDMSLGSIEKKDEKVFYTVYIGDKPCTFSIRFEKQEEEHMVNSIIEGDLGNGKKITLTVDGALCPFATTGIILITAGSVLLM